MLEPLGRARHVRLRGIGRQRRLDTAEDEVAAHPGGEVEDDVDVPDARIRSTTSLYSAGSREGPPVSGFRTWMCATAAPACAASIAAAAICGGADRDELAACSRRADAGDRAGDEGLGVQRRLPA